MVGAKYNMYLLIGQCWHDPVLPWHQLHVRSLISDWTLHLSSVSSGHMVPLPLHYEVYTFPPEPYQIVQHLQIRKMTILYMKSTCFQHSLYNAYTDCLNNIWFNPEL